MKREDSPSLWLVLDSALDYLKFAEISIRDTNEHTTIVNLIVGVEEMRERIVVPEKKEGRMKIDDVTTTVLRYADDILTHERELLDLEFTLADARAHLKDVEATALLEGVCDGKNQETRDAQLRKHVEVERIEVELAERQVMRKRLQLGAAKTMWTTWKAAGDWTFVK